MDNGRRQSRARKSQLCSVGGRVMVLNVSPHPNAGLLWARWLLSEEAQKFALTRAKRRPMQKSNRWTRAGRRKFLIWPLKTAKIIRSIKNCDARSFRSAKH